MPMESVYVDVNKFFEKQDNLKKKAKISERLRKSLEKKAKDHNESVDNNPDKKTNVPTLFKVYERGIGAYNTNPQSVRPSVSSPEQWAMARVNSYLYALKNGKYRSGKHDTDLLPEGHPMSSKEKPSEKAQTFDDYPQTASNNAKRMIEWRDKYGRDVVTAGTNVGWRRASQLANREAISLDVVKRMAQFNRHRENAKIDPKYKGEPWKDNGYVAWNLWGGTAGVDWAIRTIEKLKND